MRRIISSSLKARLLVVAIAAAVMVFGFMQLDNVPVDVLPEFTPPTVEIQTEALGLSAVEVEQLITAPFEQDLLSQVPFLDVIRSESIPGLSSIELIFEPGTDLLDARQLVQERLSEALVALPGVSSPPRMIQPLSSMNRVMTVKLSSDELSLIEMSVLARWTIRPRLMGVPGVANVSVWGHREQQLQVRVDPERLLAQGVSLQQVVRTTGNSLWVSPLTFLEASTPGTGGFIETPNQRLGVQHLLPIRSPEDLAQVPVEGAEDRGLRLGDVAEIAEDHQLLIGDAVFTDGPGLLLVVEKLPEANTLDVTEEVEEALEALRPGLGDMQIDTSIHRPATYIETAIDNIGRSLLLAVGLVVLALAALLFSWRTAAITILAILLSFLAAGLTLYLRGAPMNAIVLAGLVMALGAVVDDAVIDVENISRRLRQHRSQGSGKSAASVVLEGAFEMRSAILLAVLIMLMAALPAFFMDSLIGGAFSRPLALSYALAVAASMAVALVVTPTLCLLLLRRARPEPPLARWLESRYDRLFPRIMGSPRRAYAAAALLGVAALAVLPFTGKSLLPSFRDTALLIEMEAAPGTSLPGMSRIVGQAVTELRSIPGVLSAGAHVGRAVTSDQVVGVNSAQLWVSVDPTADYDETVTSIETVVAGYPGVDGDLVTYPRKRMTEVLAGEAGEPIVVRIYGVAPEVLANKAAEVRQVLSGIDGVVDPTVDGPGQEPTVEVEVDIAAAYGHGIKPGDVRRAAATLLSAIIVGNLFEEQKVFEVVVWGTPQVRQNLTTIRNLGIDTPGGSQVRLGDVADVRITPNPIAISHDASSRHVDVTAGVRGRDLGPVLADVERGLEQIEFPLEHHAELLSDYAELQAAQRGLVTFAVAAAIGVLLLLQAAFGSWRLASVVFLSLPMALSGGVLAGLAGGRVLTLGSVVGLFLVFGIAARNAVVLIKSYQRRTRRDGEPFGPELVRSVTGKRLVPILVTAATTGLAVLPFLLFGDVPGHEILRPMTIAVLGGLVTSTLLSTLVVPALYLRFGSKPSSDDLSLELEEDLLSAREVTA